MLLSFNRTDFHIHACNKSCACDFLEVRAGTTSKGKFLGKFCGSIPPSPIYVSGSDVWLRFVTNKRSNNKGFLATYKAANYLAGIYTNILGNICLRLEVLKSYFFVCVIKAWPSLFYLILFCFASFCMPLYGQYFNCNLLCSFFLK